MTNGSAGISLTKLKSLATVFKLTGALVCVLVLSSCENDLKKIREISAKYNSSPVEKTTGVEVIYSDSAHVKAKVETPLMLSYKVKNPYYEMPKGVKITFYDQDLKLQSTVISDYAIRRENEKIIELDKNVVATNEKGDVFKSDQLIWNESDRKVTSNKPVTIITSNGSIIRGGSLKTNEKFDPWDINNTNGTFHVEQNFSQQQP
ncbi:LPS export ABC transporter periplasmic protein LptC [Mucilaginibacter ginkgonis]|uniref:LPS export ABC transporter periplasmic protein LptC n=1 Tax=Mucilaginibacter ginkgonis TaxID=2682091 RepID=A0A6I4I115_9SPHI|nr:LPS export ABC transporter periplasmic protein LptC [Mucilaginibacter ginkgonis]QQL48810.1 LPS export ABC transporter periplasmic protein LptC [Mucilaginibacter ginkgonis]